MRRNGESQDNFPLFLLINRKKFLPVFGGHTLDFGGRNVLDFRNGFGHPVDVKRRITAAAVRLGRHVRGIGFNHQAVERDSANDLDGLARVFEGNHPGEGDIIPCIKQLVRDGSESDT